MKRRELFLKIAAVAAFIYASIAPATYALLSGVVHLSAFVDVGVLVSCGIVFADVLERRPVWLYLSAMGVLLAASLVGRFVHFRDSGESGPLPYEWLNHYYLFSTPLVLVSAASRLLRQQKEP